MFSATKYNSTKGSFLIPNNETTYTNFNHRVGDIGYKVNGGGRDTYIYNDNGGFSNMHNPRSQDRPGGFFPTVNRSPDAAKKFSHVN